MFSMATFSKHETSFLKATAHIVDRDWRGPGKEGVGAFARKSGISAGYLSEILGFKKCPKIDKQEKISETSGFKSLLEFVKFGEELSDNEKQDTTAHETNTQSPQRRKTDLEKHLDKTHKKLVGKYVHKELALELNQVAIDIEKLDGEVGLRIALDRLEDLRDKLIKKKGQIKTGTEGKL